MMKHVIVRNDENIIHDLIEAAGKYPLPSGRSSLGETRVETDFSDLENQYAMKERIGRIVAAEEKKLISDVLNKTNWNRRKAAKMLEISYRSLLYKIKEYKLNDAK